MFKRFMDRISGAYNARQIDTAMATVRQIRDLESQWQEMSHDDILAKTEELRDRIAEGASLDDILPEAYALVCVAASQLVGQTYEIKGQELTWEMIPYDVQLLGGIVLHQGNIAEMKTGEGKTLVATLPAYLNALTGKGVHVVTVNDYLVSFQAAYMGKLYEHLGLSVGMITKQTQPHHRREQYECDITYIENTELGFDYLRDNLVSSPDRRVMLHRPLHYAIIDEIDSVLIDEARTPLIISQPSAEATEKYTQYAQLVTMLTPAKGQKRTAKGLLQKMRDDKEDDTSDQDGDYFVDPKQKNAILSSQGIAKLEEMLQVENLYRDVGYEEIHHIENALKAASCYQKDIDYMINDDQVMIIDPHTGRLMPGRRYNQGLHQAIEAKENVTIQKESKTVATITYQNFFKLYEKLAGMTGTASTEGEEFESIYDLQTVVIPTNKPTIRVDLPDELYVNQHAKRQAIMETVSFYHSMDVPILIGTSSIATSEYISGLLRQRKLKHFVLNAKYHEQEAHIVSNAGKAASIVVATNMAGRGTDIKLQNDLLPTLATNYANRAKQTIPTHKHLSITISSSTEAQLFADAALAAQIIDTDGHEAIIDGQSVTESLTIRDASITLTTKPHKKSTKSTAKDEPLITITWTNTTISSSDTEHKNLHLGLMIIGTEKHDARRIDNQLRGRAGRQGDPGKSQFFLSLDDDLMKKVLGNQVGVLQNMASMLLGDEVNTTALTSNQFTKRITSVQKQMEGGHYSSRKRLLDYDDVISQHRVRIYDRRDQLLSHVQPADADSTDDHPDTPKTDDTTTDQSSVLDTDTIYETLSQYADDVQSHLLSTYMNRSFDTLGSDDTDQQLLANQIAELTGEPIELTPAMSQQEIATHVSAHIERKLDHVRDMLTSQPDEALTSYSQNALAVLDHYWMQHIDDMTYLREKVALRGYAQQDPLILYKKESYTKFINLQHLIKAAILEKMFGRGAPAAHQEASDLTDSEGRDLIEDAISTITDGIDQSASSPTAQSGVSLTDIAKTVYNHASTPSSPKKKNNKQKPSNAGSNSDDVEIIEV